MTEETIHTADYLSVKALEITLTGPVEIGNPFNFEQKKEEYQRIQKEVKRKMKKLFPRYCWTIPKPDVGQKYEPGSGGTGKAYSPPYYLECSINCYNNKHSIEKYNFLIRKIKIKFYEFGFATVSVLCDISPKSNSETGNYIIQASDLLRIVNKFDDEIVQGNVRYVRKLILVIVEKFNNEVNKKKIARSLSVEKIVDKKTSEERNKIRSFHRIFEFKVNKTYEIKVIQKKFNKIAEISKGQWQEESLFSHFAGVANSVIIYNFNIQRANKNIDNKILERYSLAYKTVVERANAYYFIAEFLKNELSDYLREIVSRRKSKYVLKNRKKFNEAEEKLNKFVLLSSNFSSAFDEFIVNLSPQGKSIWDRMNKAWNISKTTQMLKDQLQNSLLITGEIFGQKLIKRQFWLNIIAAIFAVIGAISLVEIAGSAGFHWRSHIDIWNSESTVENVGDLTSQIINLIGSILAIALSAFVIIIIIFVILWSICWAVRALVRMASNRLAKK